ncbi:MAG: TonB-dependent receptor [Deltaproteobacteria bacterium]|nr:TonB-dependent receptor [Deltaproteobacteria bacterium]
MFRLRGLRALGVLGALACLMASESARADERSEARRHFDAGMALIRAGRYLPGIAELERANTILPHPSVRYNIARAYADAGLFEEAVAAFRAYLAREPEDRASVGRELAELEKQVETTRRGDRGDGRTLDGSCPSPSDAAPSDAAPRDARPTDGAPSEGRASPAEPVKRPPRKTREDERRDDAYREEVVTASRRAQSPLDAPNSITVITRQDIQLSGLTRIPELLRRVAGMDVMQITGGDANVSVRGENGRLSNKLLVLIDGNIVKSDLLGATFWESLMIGVDQIERIEVVRGPGSSIYGADAFSGVVNILTIAPGEGKSGGRAGFGEDGQVYGSAWASMRKGDFAFHASTGYTRYSRWTREVVAGRSDVTQADADPNLGAENLRFALRSSLRLGKERSLEVGGGFARATLDIYGIGPFNDYAVRTDFGDATVAFRSPHLVAKARYSYLGALAQANHAYLGHSRYEALPRQQGLDVNVDLMRTFRAPSWLTQSVVGGVGYRLKKVDWSYLTDVVPLEHHVGVFAQDALRFGERLGLTLSGRLDWVPALRTVVPSARATFLAAPDSARRQALKASFATAFRSPTMLEAYLDLPVQLQLSGLEVQSSSARDDDPSFRLGPEKILAVELQYQNQASDDVQLEVAGYYHRIQDRIQLAQPRRSTLSELSGGVGGYNAETGRYRVASGGWENSCGVDHVVGGEAGGRYLGVEGLDLFANYAVNVSFRERSSSCADPGDQRTSQHKVNAGAQVRTRFGLNGEVTFHYQTSQLWSERIATATGLTSQSFPLPAYHLLNARVGYALPPSRRAEFSAVIWNALADVFEPAPQMHPFGNRVGRRVMGFFSYQL